MASPLNVLPMGGSFLFIAIRGVVRSRLGGPRRDWALA